MDEVGHVIRLRLLEIVGAIGEIREHASALGSGTDANHIDLELTRMQAAAHRLLEFLESMGDRN